MKKILFLIPTLGEGGAEKVLTTLVNNLNKDKYNITVQTLFNEGMNRYNLEPDIRYKYNFPKIFRGYTYILKIFSPKILYKFLIKEKYDILVSYLEGPTTRIIGGEDTGDVKLINWIHTEVENEYEFLKTYRSLREFENIYLKYNNTVFVSMSAKNTFENVFHKLNLNNNIVKYNTVDTNQIVYKSLETINDITYSKDCINIVSVGRFTKEKGFERLLKVVNSLKNKGYKFHLYLIGKGKLEKKYINYITKNDLGNWVTILGFKENPYKYVVNADLFVCSSIKEGYSTAITESLILGTPVITTKCSGMIELLGSKNEYGLITENSTSELEYGLELLIKDKELLEYYRLKAIERGRMFSLKNTVKEVEIILE